MRFARMAGSSIAAPDAAGWVTDFLNAAYYRCDPAARDIADLQLAWGVVTTRWARAGGRRLRAGDVVAFHRAFGRRRLEAARSPRGMLSREQLHEGAAQLLGDWFPDAWDDDGRRSWGIAFPSTAERDEFRPERQLRLARLGPLSPPAAPEDQQRWHTYPAVALPSGPRAVEALSRTHSWSDLGTEIGRFTALRSTSLSGQTFEIEVATGAESGRPVFLRGYITATGVFTAEDPEALHAYVRGLNTRLARAGGDEPPAVPDGAEPLLALELTTHDGHFMGRAFSQVVLFEEAGRAFIRDVGTWDPMPRHLARAYEHAGREAQHAFWGQGHDPRRSMFHRLAASI